MKSMIKAILAVAFFTPPAFAEPTYTLPEGVVAQVVTAGAFRPVTAPNATGIDIMADGAVILFKSYDDGHTDTLSIGTLTPSRLDALKRATAEFSVGELVQADPSRPSCFDAPGTTYLARNAVGEAVVLQGHYGCNKFERVDREYSSVPRILDGFVALGYLQ